MDIITLIAFAVIFISIPSAIYSFAKVIKYTKQKHLHRTNSDPVQTPIEITPPREVMISEIPLDDDDRIIRIPIKSRKKRQTPTLKPPT